MTVDELIAELKQLPPDAQVILQSDAEGNSYSPLYAVDGDAIYVPDSEWHGRVYDTDWDAEDAYMETDQWEAFKANNRPCCVLAPTN